MQFYGWRERTSPANIQKRIIDMAYHKMSFDKKFATDIKYKDLSTEDQKKYISKAIDIASEIGTAYKKSQEHMENVYDHFDPNYLDLPPEPEEDEFENNQDYQKALSEWEAEREQAESSYFDDYVENNLPYCLDNKVLENIQKLLEQKSVKVPSWMKSFFNREETSKYYPEFLRAIDMAVAKKTKTKKAKGWYGKFKNL